MRVCSEKMDLPVISEVNPQYFKLKQINKCIRKFLKKIRNSKVDGKALGCLMVIVMNGNIK